MGSFWCNNYLKISCKKFKYIQDLYWICRYRQCFAPQCNGRSSSIGTRFCKQLTAQSCLSPASLIYTHLNLCSASISMVFIICALLLKDHSLIVFSTNFFQPMWYMPLWKKDGIDAIRYSKHPAPPDACDYVHKYFWPFRYNRRLYDTLAPWLINACGKSTGTIFIRFQKCA